LDLGALNEHTHRWPFEYGTIFDALALLQPGDFMAKVDLHKAFNQLPLHPDDALLMGMQLEGKDGFHIPTRAIFGGKSFPAYMNAFMAEVRQILAAKGIMVVYLTDDIFVSGSTKAKCQANLDRVKEVLASLGFVINPDKTVEPTQTLTFLGIVIHSDPDPKRCHLSIEKAKVKARQQEVQECIARLDTGNAFCRREYESLLGKLSWIAGVLPAGKPRVACIWKALPPSKQVRHNKPIRISANTDGPARTRLSAMVGRHARRQAQAPGVGPLVARRSRARAHGLRRQWHRGIWHRFW
jgi:hypothetical protein